MYGPPHEKSAHSYITRMFIWRLGQYALSWFVCRKAEMEARRIKEEELKRQEEEKLNMVWSYVLCRYYRCFWQNGVPIPSLVCHTHDACLNCWRYRNAFCTYDRTMFLVSWGQILWSWVKLYPRISMLKIATPCLKQKFDP